MRPNNRNAALLNSLPNHAQITVPKRLCCPIGYEIMNDPVIDPTMRNADGAIVDNENVDRFERATLTGWIYSAGNKSIVTGRIISAPLLTDFARKKEIYLFMREQLLAHKMYLVIDDIYFKYEHSDETHCKFVFMQGDNKILITPLFTKKAAEEFIKTMRDFSDLPTLSTLHECLEQYLGRDDSAIVISTIQKIEIEQKKPFLSRFEIEFAELRNALIQLVIVAAQFRILTSGSSRNHRHAEVFQLMRLSFDTIIFCGLPCAFLMEMYALYHKMNIDNIFVATRDAMWNRVHGVNNNEVNLAHVRDRAAKTLSAIPLYIFLYSYRDKSSPPSSLSFLQFFILFLHGCSTILFFRDIYLNRHQLINEAQNVMAPVRDMIHRIWHAVRGVNNPAGEQVVLVRNNP